MAFTEEQIRALERRALEVALAIQLFRFRWWARNDWQERSQGKYLLSAGNAAVFKHGDNGTYIWDEAKLLNIPNAPTWDSEVPRLTAWDGMGGYFAVIFEMEELGWNWFTDVRLSLGKMGRQGKMERIAGFHRVRRDEEGTIKRSWSRTIRLEAIRPSVIDLPIATCQAALWTLQPWEDESWKE